MDESVRTRVQCFHLQIESLWGKDGFWMHVKEKSKQPFNDGEFSY